MVRLTALSTWYWTLAQDSGGSPINLEVLGVSGTIVAILLYICKTLWSDNKELRAENNTIQQVSIERVAEVSAKGSSQLMESAKTLEAATVMMHQLSGRPGLSPDQLAEVNYHLRALRELREKGIG